MTRRQLSVPVTTVLLGVLLFLSATCASADSDEPKFRIVPADARVQKNGRVLENGAFTLWDEGVIGDYIIAPRDATLRISVSAAAQVQDEIPARLAVDVLPINGRPIRAGVLEVRSTQFSYGGACDYSEYNVDLPLREGYYELRITHLNRTVKEGKWRHCFVTGIQIDGALLADCSPASYTFFGAKDYSGTQLAGSETQVIDTAQLHVELSPATATWSVLHKGSGNRASGIRPAFRIADLAVDLSRYSVGFARKRVHDKAIGDAIEFSMRYHKAGELDVTYCLVISQTAGEAVARVDFVNRTRRELVIDSVAPITVAHMSLGDDASQWTLIGDGKQYRHPYRIVDVASLDEFECWWYAALKNRANRRSILLGSLENNKGLGRFLVTQGGTRAVKVAAYHDYEDITMPPSASISGERTLLQFGNKGTDSLERFGDLVAANHGIHLRRDFPLDPHDSVAVTLFNGWSGYGASVVSRFPYKNGADPAKQQHAYRNREWDRANRRQLYSLGLSDYGYAGGAWDRLNHLKERPLTRRYGRVDEFEGNTPLVTDRRDWYPDGRIDFSNPEVIEFERNRIIEAIKQSQIAKPGAMVIYNWDFTNEWRTLPGQYDPFLTGAETYRTAMSLWRDLTEATPGGGCGCVYMNAIGNNYGLAKIMRVGEDSDRGYFGDNVFTMGCTFTEGLVRQLSGRYFYNGRAFWINPDSFHVYVGGLYSYQQAKTHASFCAIAGNRMAVAEPFVEYDTPFPEDRLEIIRRVAPTTGEVATAVDVFEHCPARLWNMPIQRSFGQWNVVALFNTDCDRSGREVKETIRFDDLELSSDTEYLVHEFWSNRFLGIHKGSFSRTLRAPDCEVYSIVQMQEHPVVISTSRHVRQMAYEILDLAWDPESLTLRGTSKLARNDPYQLRIFVPNRYLFKRAKAGKLPVDSERNGAILAVDFASPRNEQVDWQVAFRELAAESLEPTDVISN